MLNSHLCHIRKNFRRYSSSALKSLRAKRVGKPQASTANPLAESCFYKLTPLRVSPTVASAARVLLDTRLFPSAVC